MKVGTNAPKGQRLQGYYCAGDQGDNLLGVLYREEGVANSEVQLAYQIAR
jgi:hypothetical protein